jgi:hypothetical protein
LVGGGREGRERKAPAFFLEERETLMSETNGSKKRYKKLKTMVVGIKQLLADELEEFEKFKKPLIVEGQPMDGAINVMMNRILKMTLYGPDGKTVDDDFLKGLSFEAKVGLANDSMRLSGGDALAKEAAKNA